MKHPHRMTCRRAAFLKINILGALLWAGSPAAAAPGKDAAGAIVISNNAGFKRVNEIIRIPRSQFRNIPAGRMPVIRDNGRILVSQTVDSNGDGNWDTLLIQVSLLPGAKDTLEVSWVEKSHAPHFSKYTNVRLSLRSKTKVPNPEINRLTRTRGFVQDIADPVYQMEGPGIENDKVAFRAFFDHRNGKDIYGKITDQPVLEQVGVGASWHEMQPWGMDILRVGNSLGAGALAVEERDSIYPLADADTTVFRSLYEGPLEAAFQLSFKHWDAGSGQQNGSETITISKGNFYYRNDIQLALTDPQRLLSGIGSFDIDRFVYKKHNEQFSSVSTFAGQAEGTGTRLGLAIMFANDAYADHRVSSPASAIPNTSYVALKPAPDGLHQIRFFACWEKTDPRFSTREGFESYLQSTAQRLASPIQVTIITK